MSISIIYGIGGYCANCEPTHDHPLNNIIEQIEIDEPPVADEDIV
jgi:hypothetical protein